MTIDHILLENFRCYRKREFKVSPAISLVVGCNTSGKTSLLEAVFLLASGRSPRAGLDREMVGQGAPFASVVGDVSGKTLEVQLIAREHSPTLTTKKFKVNGVARRLGDFLPQFHAVLFSPEDLDLVTGRPDRRRRFVNFALASVDPRYRRALREYDKVRKRRNRLLEGISQGRQLEGELGFWDAKLLEFGTFLQDERKKFFDEINSLLHNSFFIIHYSVSGLTAERLRELRPREIAAETTLIGPHRDDFSFNRIVQSSNYPVVLSAFGSRSEQRRAVLALKKAEMEFVEGKIGERPVLLLDDIFSELDEDNSSRVAADFASGGQTIITTADSSRIPKALQKGSVIVNL